MDNAQGPKAARSRRRRKTTAAATPPTAPAGEATPAPPPPPSCQLTVDVGTAQVRWQVVHQGSRHAGQFPAAVALGGDGNWRVGEAAVAGSLRAADAVVFGSSGLLGQPDASAASQHAAARHGSARCAEDHGDAAVLLAGEMRRPEELVAVILAEATRRATDAAQAAPEACTLAVPLHADVASRRAWRQAAALAGLPRPRLVHTTSAAGAALLPAFVAKATEGLLCVVDAGASAVAVTVFAVTPPARPDGEAPSPEGDAEATAGDETYVGDDAEAARLAEAGAADADADAEAEAGADVSADADAEPDAEAETEAHLDADVDLAAHLLVSATADAVAHAAAPAAAAAPAVDLTGYTLQVRAHRVAPALGGQALDAALVRQLAQAFAAEHDRDARATPLGLGRLWLAAQRARHGLDATGEVRVTLPHLAADVGKVCHLDRPLTRDAFATLTEDAWLDQVVALCRAACRAAGAEPRQLKGWACVGGLAAAPTLAGALRRLFGRNPLALAAPQDAAAAAPAQGADEASVAALGRTLADGTAEVVLAAGTPLPAEVRFTVATQVDEQDLLRVPLLVAELDDPSAWREAGLLQVDDLPARAAGALAVQLTLTVDAEAGLHAEAVVAGTAQRLPVQHLGLPGLDGPRMARLAQRFAAQLEARRAAARLRQLRADAEALLQQTAAGADASTADAAADATGGAATAGADAGLDGDGDGAPHAALRDALQEALARAEADAQGERLAALADLTPLEGHLQALRAAAASRARPTAAALGA